MSDFIRLDPGPIALGSMWTNDTDGAFQIDATRAMDRRGTTIASVGTAIVERQDGVTIGADDMVILASAVALDGKGWVFQAQTKGNAAVYLVGFPLTLSNGDLITRWCSIRSANLVG